jgi:hypothetical protein
MYTLLFHAALLVLGLAFALCWSSRERDAFERELFADWRDR